MKKKETASTEEEKKTVKKSTRSKKSESSENLNSSEELNNTEETKVVKKSTRSKKTASSEEPDNGEEKKTVKKTSRTKKSEKTEESDNAEEKKSTRKARSTKTPKSTQFDNFPQYVDEIVVPGIQNNIDEIRRVFTVSDNKIEKNDWLIIKKIISDISEKLAEYNKLCRFNNDIHKKPNSSLSGLDIIRENKAKENVIKYIDGAYNEPYKSYMIYSHIKRYIIESCKEIKV